mmetsp:Transcript_23680/g.47522  ORF Transcript_23680/g.47522 Transcript_23680/m.47522 type:complete len:222 (-) Transcript_23680:33-698(-)
MLPPPPPRHPLIPPTLRNAKPLERQIQPPLLRHDHPRQTGRHLRPQRHGPLPLIHEIVQLLRDLLAGLAGVQGLRFEDGGVVFGEAVEGGDVSPLGEEPGAQAHVGGVEVACSFGGVGVQGLGGWFGGRGGGGGGGFGEDVLVGDGGGDAASASSSFFGGSRFGGGGEDYTGGGGGDGTGCEAGGGGRGELLEGGDGSSTVKEGCDHGEMGGYLHVERRLR